MARDARHEAQVRAQNKARNVARSRVLEAHAEEYRAAYAEECAKLGITPRPTTGLFPKRTKVEDLIAEVHASGVLDGFELVEPEPVDIGPERALGPTAQRLAAKQSMTRAEQLEAVAASVPMRDAQPTYVPVPPAPF